MAHVELKQAPRKAHPKEIHSKPPFQERKQKFPAARNKCNAALITGSRAIADLED